MNPFAVLKLLGVVMSFWKLITNAGAIYRLLKALKAVGADMIQLHKLPPCEDSKELLEAVKELMAGGLLTIPNVSADEITRSIDRLEQEMQCKAQ
jgi:hypothetical protein